MANRAQNRATYRLALEGANLGLPAVTGLPVQLPADAASLMDRIGPRLISLTLTEKRGGDADQLDIKLHDHDGQLAIPQPGQVLSLQLGWQSGPDVTIGLIDKGRFKVDEASWEGPPDTVTIRARSANFAASFDKRRERSHVGKTIGAILRQIAADQGLDLQVAAALAAITVDIVEQDELSDAALLRLLGRRYDAAATIKAGVLLFAPIGSGTSPAGAPLPSGALTRAAGDRYFYRRGERGQFGGVEARWHDKKSGKRRTVSTGSENAETDAGKPPKRLKRTYASEKSARHAAQSAQGKMDRKRAEFDLELALGRPELYPEQPMQLSGFKDEIDARRWLVGQATHTLDGSGGLTSALKLEAAS